MRVRSLVVVAVALAAVAGARAQTPVEAARALVARYHEDLAGLDRARDLLQAALATDRKVDTMVMLSYVQFLVGDVRATNARRSPPPTTAAPKTARAPAGPRPRATTRTPWTQTT